MAEPAVSAPGAAELVKFDKGKGAELGTDDDGKVVSEKPVIVGTGTTVG